MNNIRKILFITFSAAVLMFTACNSAIGTGTVKGDGIKANKSVTLNLSTNGDYTVFSTKTNSSAGRTIVSDSYTSTGLKFYLYGENVTKGTYLDLQEISVTAKENTGNKQGTASLEIGSFVWDLTIVAYDSNDLPNPLPSYTDDEDEEDVLENAVLVGKAYADLRGATNQVDFVLMPDGLTKTGPIALSVYTGGWSMSPDYSDYSVIIGIYDHATGAEISTLSKADEETTQSYADDDLLPDSDPGSANYTANGAAVNPGNTYDLIVEFTAPSGKKYYWSDNLIVLPGKGTEAAVIIPDTIMKPPAAPTDFKAGYFVPAVSDTSLYKVEFDWVRSASKTEKNYELEIAQLGVPDDEDDSYTTPADDDTWDAAIALSALTTTVTYGEDFAYNPYIWESGSLKKASHTAVAKLVLGNRYIARIRAVNEAGPSAWVYATLDNTTNDATAFSSQTINLYRITYQETDINGLEVTYAPNDTPTVEYHNQNEDPGIEIMFPNRKADDGRDITVTDNSGAYWSYWKEYNDKDSDPEAYTGFENLTLIPVFAKQANITIHDDAAYLMNNGNIELTLIDFEGNDTTRAIDANNSVEINISRDPEDDDAESIVTAIWTITYPEDIVYDYCYLTMAKTSNLTSYIYNKNIDKPSLTFTMDVSICESAKYLAVLHYGINNKEYTLPILVSIVE